MSTGTNGLDLDVAAGLASTQSVGNIVDDMGTVLARITADAEEALALWKGNASGAFQGAVTAWKDEATQLQTALDALKTSLSTGFNGYDAEDQDTAGIFHNVAGSGPALSL
jgi:WXG100 family type VII secretion target